MRKKKAPAKKATSKRAPTPRAQKAAPTTRPAKGNTQPIETTGPQFAQPITTPDPTAFTVQHGSDSAAYKILDSQKGKLLPRPFPVAKSAEPVVTLADAIGTQGASVSASIQRAGQIVFHVVGDTGNTKGPKDMELVADKMTNDYTDTDPKSVPSFCYHVGDVIYSFGEAQYYYDQFYDPFRNYPAPIFAIPGNHDGMVAPNTEAVTLDAFLQNFCAPGGDSHRTPEAGELVRTAQVQPGVYFTLEAPFVRILGLYSNCLEDPGIISTQSGTYPGLTDAQLTFLETALERVVNESFAGAVLIAVHHPPYVAALTGRRHGGSPNMLKEIDAVCASTGCWPHAVLSGHAHNYQRFTRAKDGRETPYLVAGNGGHAVARLTHKGSPTIRTPVAQAALSNGNDAITFENYDDTDYGYLRVIADAAQLRIEYHPQSDGEDSKTPDDFVTVDLATRKLVHYQARS
jgi:hypothetical protein